MYEYTLTVSTESTENVDDFTLDVTVTVEDVSAPAPSITCEDAEIYEASDDFTLDCSVADEPSGCYVRVGPATRCSTIG